MARGFFSGLANARILRKFEVLGAGWEVSWMEDGRNWVMRARSVILEGCESGEGDGCVERFWRRESESEVNRRV